MKTTSFLILLFLSITAFGQSPSKDLKSDQSQFQHTVFTQKEGVSFINFDLLNAAYVKEAEKAAKYAHQTDSIKWAIVRNILTVAQIDFTRISQNGDSLKVTSEGVFLKLRKP